MSVQLLRLAADINDELKDIARVVERAESAFSKAAQTNVVRNVYTFNFRSSRLQELTTELRSCFEHANQDLISFSQFLHRLTE
jgi:hypothetical protein